MTGEEFLDWSNSGLLSNCSLEKPEGAPENVYILFQLEGNIPPEEFKLIVNEQSSDAEGKLWITPDMFQDGGRRFEYNLEWASGSQYAGNTYTYTLTLYASQDTNTDPLAVFSGSRIMKRTVDIDTTPDWIAGDLSTEIPFTVTIVANDFAGTLDAMLRVNKGEGMTITSDDLKKVSDIDSQSYDYFRIGELQDATYNFTLLSTREILQGINVSIVSIVDGSEQTIPNSAWVQVSVPFNGSPDDIAGLEKIAEDNNNDYLRNYVENKGYLNNDNDSIRVNWDQSLSPARIDNLSFKFRSLTTLDLSAFDSLMYLHVNGAAITSLDLSMLKKLRSVGLQRTNNISLNQVKLPDNPDLEVSGRCEFAVGEQIDERTCQLASGEEVDLSQYATFNGKPTTIKWFKNSDGKVVEATAEWEETAPGIFVVPNPSDEDAGRWVSYWCEISMATYPNWEGSSREIQIVRGNIDYSEDDIQLLRNLAVANPNCHELQQFVEAQGWTEAWQGYGVDRNRKVAVDWNYAKPARINKLRIRDLLTVTNLDLSGFTELTYLDVTNLSGWSEEQHKEIGIETLDLTKNTKLRELMASSNSCLKTLNTSGLAALESVYLDNNSNLSSVDLAASSNTLSRLNLNGYRGPVIDLSQFPNLRDLSLSGTDQYADYLTRLPESIESVYCNNTEYPLLDFSRYPNLREYGVPKNIEELDVRNTSIRSLSMGRSQVRYSTLKASSDVSCHDQSWIEIPGLPESEESFWRNETIYDIAVNDTVDLSSEASIYGTASRYVWVDEHAGTESTGVFVPVEGELGKFVYQGGGRLGEFYHCIIANERYCRESEINQWSGWRLRTYSIMLPENQATYTYDPDEVAALEAIVNSTESPALKQWWDSKAWKTGNVTDSRFAAYWKPNEGTHTYHLLELDICNLEDTLKTLDVAAFTELSYLVCGGNGIAELSVQSNANLEYLQAGSCPHLKSLTLPDAKERLRNLGLEWNIGLERIDVSEYTNLNTLNLSDCNSLTYAGDLSRLVNLEYLLLTNTLLEPLDMAGSHYSKLIELGVPRKTKTLDVSRLENLESLVVNGSMLTFSTLTLKEGSSCSVEGLSYPTIEGIRTVIPGRDEFTPFYLFPADKPIDLSSEMKVGDQPTQVMSGATAAGSDGMFTVDGEIHQTVTLQLKNEAYSWVVILEGQIVSCDGDANLDTKVDVRDLAVTANYIVQNEYALPEDKFGKYEADVVGNNNGVDAADMQGIVNLILNEPVTKSADGLRNGYLPAVELSVENGYLYMDAEVPVTALQLELTGMMQAEPLLGKAAGLTQLSSVGETTRILGYSLQGVTVPAGKSVLMRFPEGARLSKAVFSDAKAQSLEVRTKGDIATSNETIRPEARERIANYPNPFSGTTTLVYHLDEAADYVSVQVFNFNGALVDIVEGLPAAAGENRFTYSARLAAGSYLYRLVVRKQDKTSYSKSNTFIIK